MVRPAGALCARDQARILARCGDTILTSRSFGASTCGLQIRCLELDAARMALHRGLPVAALVFPRYQTGAGLEQVRITTAEAFADLCHARSMLDRHPEVLAETLQWIGSVPAYRLTYGDLDRAADWALSLLGAENESTRLAPL